VLDGEVDALRARLDANRRGVELAGEHRALLASLRGFVAPAATVELTRGVLNAETRQRLTDFIREQREAVVGRELALAAEGKSLAKEMELRRRQTLDAGRPAEGE